jgi:SnoaL-like domain
MKTNISDPSRRKFLSTGAAALASLKLIDLGGAAHAAVSKGSAAADTLESVDKIAQEALDIQDVQNVWSLHCHMNARGQNREEIDAIWAQRQPDVAYIESDGMWVGLDAVKRGYCEWFEASLKERLKKIRKLYPKFEDDPKYAFVGWQKMTTNASPDIVIAGDGKTAKGSWESVGFITDSDMAMWVYQRYFVDFIKEDGAWKIWHANLLVNMNHDPEKSWADSNGELMKQKKSDYGEPRPAWTKTEMRSQPYAKDKLSGILTPDCPRRPESYYTFSETHSYGPDMLESWARVDAKS